MTKNGHVIREVVPGSIAEELQIECGDRLLSIGGTPIEDIFDYQFLLQDSYIEVVVHKTASDEEWLLEIEKDPEEDLGILFDSDLMDSYRACSNHCVFCFIDQNPPGMRETIYFKDDDARLSFLQGNYVTLTNMRPHDAERIIRYRMEPINISFHTTDPELRCRMLHNRHAGACLSYVRQFAEAGIAMNGQIVLCKGFNDGEELDRTIGELTQYLPHLKSLSVVPVGLTRHRQGLTPLEPFSAEEARMVLRQIHTWQDKIFLRWKTHFVHGSDEWYLLSNTPIPAEETYDGYPQLENGVGRMRLLENEMEATLREIDGDLRHRTVSYVSGMLVQAFLTRQLQKIRHQFPQMQILYYPLRNDFYGETITVTGLITGGDLIRQLKGKELGEALLLPETMLRVGEEVFLDDVTVTDVERELQIPTIIVRQDGEDLCRCLLGEPRQEREGRRQGYEQADLGYRRKAERRKIDSF